MPIENYPVWSFEPNWDKKVSENLAWLTDILGSPTGSEQRRSMREYPRRQFEFAILVDEDERTLLSGMLATHPTAEWYLPIWHEVDVAFDGIAAGATSFTLVGARKTQFMFTNLAFITNGDPYEFEIVETSTVATNDLNFASPVVNNWPAGSRIYPLTVGRLTDPVELNKVTSTALMGNVRFLETLAGAARTLETNSILTSTYTTFPVLNLPPDDQVRLNHKYEVISTSIDNQTSMPVVLNDAGRTFSLMEYYWTLVDRDQHTKFMRLLETLRGRAKPLWVPTFMDDFKLVAETDPGSIYLKVARSGYVRSGGPRPDRDHIMIQLVDGTTYYRKILAAIVQTTGERLQLDIGIATPFAPSDVLRISFMSLSRLNHDDVDILHRTDNTGVSEVKMIFRSAPNTRTRGE